MGGVHPRVDGPRLPQRTSAAQSRLRSGGRRERGCDLGRAVPRCNRRRSRVWVPRTPFGLFARGSIPALLGYPVRAASQSSAHTDFATRTRADTRLPRAWQRGWARRQACERRTRGAAGYAAILYSRSKPPSRSRRRRSSSCGNSAPGAGSSIGGLASGVR